MKKQLIIKELTERHANFVEYILSLSEEQFMFSYKNKWTAGQQMDHIFRAVSILPFAYKIPKKITALFFGRVNRPLLGYDELVKKYQARLYEGAKASALFIPKKIAYKDRHALADKLFQKVRKINAAIDAIPDDALDRFMLPHPILGKLTYREMLYFTIYHVNHHYGLLKQYLAESSHA